MSAINYYVLQESRIGQHEVSPIYTVYGGYASRDYARKVLRDIARSLGNTTKGLDDYMTVGSYFSGVLNTHRVTIIADRNHSGMAKDSKGNNVDIYSRSVKYDWKG